MPAENTYNYKVIRQFSIMTIVWGVVGMLVGVLIASQLIWPALNFDTP
jgi:cytochrome c oxidase cbb3-type subunit 1